MFEQLSENIETISELTVMNTKELASLKESNSGLPDDYLRFMQEVGYGNLGDIQLYGNPILAKKVYGDNPNLKHIILFGDDFQGYCFGFDESDNFRLVEVNPKGEIDNTVEPSFTQLIEGYFG